MWHTYRQTDIHTYRKWLLNVLSDVKITMQWCFLLTGTGLKGLISLFSFIEHNFTFQCTDIHAKKYHHNNTPINPWFIFQSRMVVKTLQSNDHWHSEHMWNDWYSCFYYDSWQLAVFNGRWAVLETLDPLIDWLIIINER